MSYFRRFRLGFILGPLSFVIGWALLTLNYSSSTATHVWFIAHVFLVSGAALSTIPVLELRQIVVRERSTWASNLLASMTLLGLFLFASQLIIDIAVWLRSTSAEEMDALFGILQGSSPIRVAFYTAGPSLFFIGLLAYAALLIRKSSTMYPAAFMIVCSVIVVVATHLMNWHPLFSVMGYLLLAAGFALVGRKRARAG